MFAAGLAALDATDPLGHVDDGAADGGQLGVHSVEPPGELAAQRPHVGAYVIDPPTQLRGNQRHRGDGQGHQRGNSTEVGSQVHDAESRPTYAPPAVIHSVTGQ